jgi:hypothetical protein
LRRPQRIANAGPARGAAILFRLAQLWCSKHGFPFRSARKRRAKVFRNGFSACRTRHLNVPVTPFPGCDALNKLRIGRVVTTRLPELGHDDRSQHFSSRHPGLVPEDWRTRLTKRSALRRGGSVAASVRVLPDSNKKCAPPRPARNPSLFVQDRK